MPKVHCPICDKAYNVPDQMVGQVASCKCGNKFRLEVPPEPPVDLAPDDSFWDEALDDETLGNGPSGLDAAASMMEPESPRAPVFHRKKSSQAGTDFPWLKAGDLLFRALSLAMPFVVWKITQDSLNRSWEEGGDDQRLFGYVLLLVLLPFGVAMAKHGIGLDRGSMRQRLTGLVLCISGVATIVLAVLLTVAISSVTQRAGLVVISSGVVGGLIMILIGLMQVVTGRDLRGETHFTRVRDE